MDRQPVLEGERLILRPLRESDWDALFAYRSNAPYAVEMHPTDEHLMPWYVAAGAGGRDAVPLRIHDSATMGSLGMDAYAFSDMESRTPRSKWKRPARAIIAALSVARRGAGAYTAAPSGSTRSRIASASARLHATPPPSTTRFRSKARTARAVFSTSDPISAS